MEETYVIPERPEYSADIRKLQDSDPASASAIFNPLFERIIENIHYLKLNTGRRVLAVRELDPSEPDGDDAPIEEDTGDTPIEEDTGDTPIEAEETVEAETEEAAVDDAGEAVAEDEEAAEESAPADTNA